MLARSDNVGEFKFVDYKLCFVTNFLPNKYESFEQYLELIIRPAIEGGVTLIQLREKNNDQNIIINQAVKLQTMLTHYNIPLIINDYPEVAKKVDAAGVHLGQGDMNIFKAREILGDKKIIGLTIETLEQLEVSKNYPIDYIGAGSIFPSLSKLDYREMGLSTLAKICANSPFPVLAIGGINLDNIEKIIQTRISGVAVIGAIQNAANPYQAAYALSNFLNNHLAI